MELDEAIERVDIVQTSVDDASEVAAMGEVIESIAENLYVTSQILEAYEHSDALHEPVRERLFILTKSLHHLLLVLRMHCKT